MKRGFTAQKVQMLFKQMNKCLTSLVVTEMHIETMPSYFFVCTNQIGKHINRHTTSLIIIEIYFEITPNIIIFYQIGKI